MVAPYTRFGLEGYGVRRAGSFAGKTPGVAGGPHPVGIITRLGLEGYGVRRAGSFAGRVPAVPVTTRPVSDTSDPLFYEWWRQRKEESKRRPKKKRKHEQETETIAIEAIPGEPVSVEDVRAHMFGLSPSERFAVEYMLWKYEQDRAEEDDIEALLLLQ